MAGRYGVAILVIHHVRKDNGSADPFEKVSGTLGLTGAADTVIILDRDGRGCTLYCRGRDIEEYERTLRFNKQSCVWSVHDEGSDVKISSERSAILGVLRDATDLMSPAEIANAAGVVRNNCDQLLMRMKNAGEVNLVTRGQYVHPERPDLIAATPNKNRKNVRSGDGK